MTYMLNISLPACTKVELWDLTVCILVNGEKFRTVTLTLVRQCLLLNLSEIFSYATMYSNFMFLDRLLFELLCKNTETHTDSDEYSLVAFCKNATMIMDILDLKMPL